MRRESALSMSAGDVSMLKPEPYWRFHRTRTARPRAHIRTLSTRPHAASNCPSPQAAKLAPITRRRRRKWTASSSGRRPCFRAGPTAESSTFHPSASAACRATLTAGHALAILPGLTHYNVFSSPPFAAATLAFLDEQPS
jgi:hypothetical protein